MIKIVLGIVLFLVIADLVRFYWYIVKGTNLARKTVPFESKHKKRPFRALFIGDSTAVGAGAKDNHDSIAGRFAADHPDYTVFNRGVNGDLVHGVLKRFRADTSGYYDLVVLQIGGNDITHLTHLQKLELDINSLIDRAKHVSKKVILMTTNDIGNSPLLPVYFKGILSRQTLKVRAIFSRVAAKNKIIYVDLYRPKKDEPFLTDTRKHYAPDFFHPSGDGYGVWYAELKKNL